MKILKICDHSENQEKIENLWLLGIFIFIKKPKIHSNCLNKPQMKKLSKILRKILFIFV